MSEFGSPVRKNQDSAREIRVVPSFGESTAEYPQNR